MLERFLISASVYYFQVSEYLEKDLEHLVSRVGEVKAEQVGPLYIKDVIDRLSNYKNYGEALYWCACNHDFIHNIINLLLLLTTSSKFR